MSEQLVRRFLDALHHLERTRDPEPIVATYAERSETSNLVAARSFAGRDGARDFWLRYRNSFAEAESSFRNVIVAGDRAALEWTTAGTSPEGEPFSYDGVSVIESAGEGDGEGIVRFRAYFDPSDLGRQLHDDGKAAAKSQDPR